MRSMMISCRTSSFVLLGVLLSAPQARGSGNDQLPAGVSAADWSSIHAAYEANRHAVFATAEGFQARNPEQQWTIRFDGHGVTAQPDSRQWMWGLQLQRYGFADAEHAVCAPERISSEGSRMTYDWDALVQEWWLNDSQGLEHGFTLRERPKGCGPLSFVLRVQGDLGARVHADELGVSFVDAGGANLVEYSGLFAFDADGQRLPARLTVDGNELSVHVDDRNARYPITIDPIAQQVYIKASAGDINDFFGFAVAISGNTVVVGAEGEDSNASGVNGNQANNTAIESGAAYIFVRNGTTWTQQAYLKASNPEGSDIFGEVVAISGDTVVIGARFEDSAATGINGNQLDNTANGAGAAYVFVRSGTTWTQQAYLKASNAAAGDLFGNSVAIDGNTIVVGANGEESNATGVNGNQGSNSATDSGAAYVFVRSGTTWTQQAYLKASNTEIGDVFASSVAISLDTIVVGAEFEDSAATGVNGNQLDNTANGSGAAYVFVRSGTTWSQQAYLKASNTGGSDLFGLHAAISGDTIVIGADSEDSNATGVNGIQSDNSASRAGAAYVFTRSGSTWSQQAYLKASNTGAGDAFGISVSISGNLIVVGSEYEDSNATGVNGNQSDNSAADAGAAYVFQRLGTTWSQKSYLKSSNMEAGDSFGTTVGVSGDTIVVGAFGEDSNSTGINGNQTDNSESFSGAAYTFVDVPDFTSFCSGDGTDTPCPCSNPGAAGRGCNNTLATGGVLLTRTGSPSIGGDSLVLHATFGTPSGPGLFFQGSLPANPFAPFGIAFGNGLQCAGGSTPRLEIRFADGTGSSATTVAIHVSGSNTAGDVRFYQLWYRDNPNLGTCTSGFNFSNAIGLTWAP